MLPFVAVAAAVTLEPIQLSKADNARAAALSDFVLPADCDGTPGHRAIVEVRLDDVRVDGKPVASLEQRHFRPIDRRGELVSALYDRLLELVESDKDVQARCNPSPSPQPLPENAGVLGAQRDFGELDGVFGSHVPSYQGQLLLAVDERVPAATLRQVLYTAEQAQFVHFAFLVDGKAGRAWNPGPLRPTAEEPRPIRLDAPPKLDDVSEDLVTLVPGPATPTSVILDAVDRLDRRVILAQPEGDSEPGSDPRGKAKQVLMKETVAVLATEKEVFRPLTSVFGTGGRSARAIPGKPVVAGEMDARSVESHVGRYTHQIRYCYQREVTKNPELAGGLQMHFVIGADGAVTSAEPRSSTLGNSAVELCVVGRFMRMKFAAPKEGKPVTVTYPFTFEPE